MGNDRFTNQGSLAQVVIDTVLLDEDITRNMLLEKIE
jgi:hypothetical protein